MNWKVKSMLQRACASVPTRREDLYYTIQKTFGRARAHDPMIWFREVADMVAQLASAGLRINGARLMEVGTGKWLDMPVGFYLCGAAGITTFDLHRYLRSELVSDSLSFIRTNPDAIRRVFARVAVPEILEERIAALSAIKTSSDVFRVANISYRAPADAAKTDLPDASIDAHFSFTVFEHIPEEVLIGVLTESNRLLSWSGVALHHIDLSDHFSHSDPHISGINFLQFSASEWNRYAGNQFAYHNRLRAPDYRRIYADSRHAILGWQPTVNEECVRLLSQGFPLAPEYRNIPPEELCISQVRILSRPAEQAPRTKAAGGGTRVECFDTRAPEGILVTTA